MLSKHKRCGNVRSGEKWENEMLLNPTRRIIKLIKSQLTERGKIIETWPAGCRIRKGKHGLRGLVGSG